MLTIILSTGWWPCPLKILLIHAYQWATCLACNFVPAFYSIFSQGLYAILTWRLLVMPKNPSSSSSLHNKPSAPILPSNKQCATHLKKGHHCGSVHLLCTNSKGDRKRKVNLAFRRSAFTTMKADVTCSRSFWGENHSGTTNTNCEMRGLPNQIIHYQSSTSCAHTLLNAKLRRFSMYVWRNDKTLIILHFGGFSSDHLYVYKGFKFCM